MHYNVIFCDNWRSICLGVDRVSLGNCHYNIEFALFCSQLTCTSDSLFCADGFPCCAIPISLYYVPFRYFSASVMLIKGYSVTVSYTHLVPFPDRMARLTEFLLLDVTVYDCIFYTFLVSRFRTV